MVVQSPHRWWGNLDKSLHHCGASLSSGCCRSSPGGKQDLYHLKVEQEEEKQEDHVGYLLVIVGIEVLLVKIELPLVHQVEVSPVQSVAQTHVGEDAVTRGEQGVRLQRTLLKDFRVHSFFSYIYIRETGLSDIRKWDKCLQASSPCLESRQVTILLTWVGWGTWLDETCKQQIVIFYYSISFMSVPDTHLFVKIDVGMFIMDMDVFALTINQWPRGLQPGTFIVNAMIHWRKIFQTSSRF